MFALTARVPHSIMLSVNLNIRPMNSLDVQVIAKALVAIGRHDRTTTLQGYLREQDAGERATFVAQENGVFAGYTTVKWISDYPPFASSHIPEIKDLNVLPVFRRQGIASRLLDAAEDRISQRSPVAGLGVGLPPDYGPAPVLYAKRGYVPDGRGVAYRDKTAAFRQPVTVDDELVLFMKKKVGE